MNWMTQHRQRPAWLLLLCALVLACLLTACGQQVNASNTYRPTKSATSEQLQYQPGTSTHASSNNPHQATHSSSSNNANTTIQSTDQQVQSILSQLDGARNDVSSSNSAASQDNGQQP